jgi:protease IV
MSLNDTPSNPPAAQDALLAQFARHYLAQQRSEQRWRWFWRAVWLTVAIVALAGIWQGVPHSAQPQPHTALVEVRGPISVSDEANADRIMASLREAFEQPSARAVVLRINSPGGSPVQAGIINDEIRRLKALHKKPVYAVCEEMCASAAYYIAVAADQIYVDKASIVGSVGVLMNGFGFVGLLDKLGIERRLMTSGSNKGMLDPFSPRDLDQEGYAQQMLEQVHQQFITVVRQGRGKRLKAALIRWPVRWSSTKTSWTTPSMKTLPSAWPSGLARPWGPVPCSRLSVRPGGSEAGPLAASLIQILDQSPGGFSRQVSKAATSVMSSAQAAWAWGSFQPCCEWRASLTASMVVRTRGW